MRYNTSDGFPITLTLKQAASIVGVAHPNLRAYIQRGLLKHVGQRPLAGAERKFSASGIVEVALLIELFQLGAETASKIVDQILRDAYAEGYRAYCSRNPAELAKQRDWSEISEHMDYHPGEWLNESPWNHRDASKPFLLVGVIDDQTIVPPVIAKGFGDIERARRQMFVEYKKADPLSTYFGEKDDDTDRIERQFKTLYVVNLTRLMIQVDKGIREVFEGLFLPGTDEAGFIGLYESKDKSKEKGGSK